MTHSAQHGFTTTRQLPGRRRHPGSRWPVQVLSLTAALLLSACGAINPFGGSRSDTPPAPAPATPAPARGATPPVTSSTTPAKPPVVQRRGGAYYQDDGPGDNAPPNLELTPDAVPKDEPPLRSATNRTYVVFGKTYTPMLDNRPFHQRGIGSWYGRKFHGQKTSSGEPYDMYAMTAAHPTLPIPSYVRVTNPANGRSVVVKVNDRGPFHSDRIIDLSYTAALKLDYVNQGSTLVDVVRVREGDRVLLAGTPAAPPGAAAGGPVTKPGTTTAAKPASTNDPRGMPAQSGSQSASQGTPQGTSQPTPQVVTSDIPLEKVRPEPATMALPTATQPDGVYLQIGAFGARESADSFRAKAREQLAWLTETIFVVPGNNLYRLQLGPYKTRDDANKVAEKIRETLQLKPVFVLK